MEVSIIDVKKFLKICNHIKSVIETKTTMPILSHILLDANSNIPYITGTDLDVSLKINLEDIIQIHTPGSICIPVKQLFELLKGKKGQIDIKTDDVNWIFIGPMKIMGLPNEDYPQLPVPKKILYKTKVPGLGESIGRVIHASGESDTRYTLNGVLLDFERGKIVSTDGHRISIINGVKLKMKSKVDPKRIINKEAAALLIKLKGEDFNLEFNDTHLWFSSDRYSITVRRIEGEYPNWTQVVPEDHVRTIVLDKDMLIEKLNGAIPIVKVGGKGKSFCKAVRMTFDKELTLYAKNPDIGEYTEKMPIQEGEGEIIGIGCNPQYILEYLSSIDAAEVTIKLTKSTKSLPTEHAPVLWESAIETDAFAVIMPMRA